MIEIAGKYLDEGIWSSGILRYVSTQYFEKSASIQSCFFQDCPVNLENLYYVMPSAGCSHRNFSMRPNFLHTTAYFTRNFANRHYPAYNK